MESHKHLHRRRRLGGGGGGRRHRRRRRRHRRCRCCRPCRRCCRWIFLVPHDFNFVLNPLPHIIMYPPLLSAYFAALAPSETPPACMSKKFMFVSLNFFIRHVCFHFFVP